MFRWKTPPSDLRGFLQRPLVLAGHFTALHDASLPLPSWSTSIQYALGNAGAAHWGGQISEISDSKIIQIQQISSISIRLAHAISSSEKMIQYIHVPTVPTFFTTHIYHSQIPSEFVKWGTHQAHWSFQQNVRYENDKTLAYPRAPYIIMEKQTISPKLRAPLLFQRKTIRNIFRHHP